MILSEPAAVLLTERIGKNGCEFLDESITLGKSVFGIIIFHALEIDIGKDRSYILAVHVVPAHFSQLEEIGHAWKAGQAVVIHLAEIALLPQHPFCIGISRYGIFIHDILICIHSIPFAFRFLIVLQVTSSGTAFSLHMYSEQLLILYKIFI